ncbi:mucin-16-like [Nothoprocta perdicaria]|uniref:mucin-16-like n=1 Tax=Nothoprocta perdicaria TaxID=30464 RepID=UPI000E1C1AF2|nr:mucin-16-like [Nothoprocta perdicaria]
MKDRDNTGLDAVCSYKNNSRIATFDREKVYQELSNMTKGVTKLGQYSLEKNSLYVNDPSINRAAVERAFQNGTSHETGLWLGSSYQLEGFSVDNLELAIETGTQRAPLQSEERNFRLNFIITNLRYSPELQNSKSLMFQVNKDKIEKELDVFRTGSLKDYFIGCTVETFGPVLGKAYTSVASVCKFTLDTSSRTLEKEVVYEELTRLTQGFTKLGSSYQLEEHSLAVDGYSPLETIGQERYELSFWAIILICVFALIGFILLLLICFLIVFCLRRKSNLYQVQQSMYGMYFPHLNMRKVH